ncbi:MAG TPA: CHAP domain-containing protein [Candidatus Saccharimonadales bacterium]|nr:CHAP domain-containing protein [Candidatus Saccharimonadales bacterium]
MRSVLAALLLVTLVSGAAMVHADQFDHQIEVLESDTAARQNKVDGLETRASSYEDQINRYQSQISSLESEISANQAKQAQLEKQIAEDKIRIATQKKYLSEDIRAMYVDGQLSTIEELATSKNLNEYVDKETYRTAIQNKVDATIKEIVALQKQLQAKKKKIEQLLDTQRAQSAQLAGARSRQQELLSYTEGQQAAFNRTIQKNSAKVAELKRLQRIANARFISSGGGGGIPSGPTCGGGYPGVWCNAPMDSIVDSWGMYNRECVSYTAFRVAASGRDMPYWGGRGNANQWDDNARAAGIPMSYGGGARRGDVAISNAGFYGHAMYVESVNGNGTINISQYNAGLDGRYSTNTISAAGLYFIHF